MLLKISSKKNTKWWLVALENRNQGVENAWENKMEKNIQKYSAYEFEIEGNLLMKEHKKSGITCSIFIYITQKRNNKVSLEIQLQFPSPNNLCKEK